MAAFFLLLAVLIGVVLVDALLENTSTSSFTLFDRSIDQLSGGELLLVFAGLGFLLALFLFLAFGSSRTRRSRRKELKSRRRDAEGRVDELERENARLREELTGTREDLETTQRGRADAVAERDRAEAATDRVRAATASPEAAGRDRAAAASPDTAGRDRAGATALDDRAPGGRYRAADGTAAPPEPTSVRRERLDDRTDVSPVREEHARAADEHARAADEHARAADEENRRR
jgi:type II secretory pathway pseudopilin PulG